MASEDIFEEHFTEEDFEENEIADEYIETDEVMDDIEEAEADEAECTDDEQIEETENVVPDETAVTTEPNAITEKEAKLLQLPLSRVRHLMKLDPDVQIVSNEAVFVVAKATQLFIESFAREAFTYTTQAKKKTMQKRDIDLAISGVDSLLFLDGAL